MSSQTATSSWVEWSRQRVDGAGWLVDAARRRFSTASRCVLWWWSKRGLIRADDSRPTRFDLAHGRSQRVSWVPVHAQTEEGRHSRTSLFRPRYKYWWWWWWWWEKNWEGAEFMGLNYKCNPRARVHSLGWKESQFYWADKDAAFNSWGIS